MSHKQNKLTDANVIGGFYIQDEAEEALLELRSVGFRDYQIGYYLSSGEGMMRDYLANYHRTAAAIIWGIIGAAGGMVLALAIFQGNSHLDWWGLACTCGTFGALLLGTLGGMMGLNPPRVGTFVMAPHDQPQYYIMAVNAGPERNQALAIFEKHGGHQLEVGTASGPVMATS